MYENFEEKLIIYKNFLTKKLFSNLELINNSNNYNLMCIYCNNKDVIMSSKYVLQRCHKCNKEYIPSNI